MTRRNPGLSLPRAAALAAILLAPAVSGAQDVPAAERQTRAEAAGGGPSVFVAEETLDLGTVREGRDVEARFVVENRGQAELRILRAKPS